MERIIADAAICFANAAGGVLIVGVADKLRGAAALKGTDLDPNVLRQRVFELTSPPLNVEVLRYREDR